MITTKKEGRSPIYPIDLKIAVARDYLTSSLGYGKLAIKYGLPSDDTVRYIVKWYRMKYPDVAAAAVVEGAANAVPASLVDKELKEANLKIMALELLIANINEEVGFDVAKKLGTKQSPK